MNHPESTYQSVQAGSGPASAPPAARAEARATPILYGLALALAAVLVYGFYLRGNLPVGADNTLFYAPFYAMHWQGGPPLWNPYSLSGTSLADNLQAALLYPLRWPFFFVTDWRDYFGVYVFIHYIVALAGMAGLLRALGVRRLAALGGAIVFALGGHMAGRIINPTIFQGSCWLPWLLWGAAGRRPVHFWLTVLGAAMIYQVGSPHLIFYGTLVYGLFFAICTLWPMWKELRIADCGLRNDDSIKSAIRNPQSAITLLLSRAAALLLAFILAAPTLVPGVLRAQSSIRTNATIEANLADSASFAELPLILLGGVRGTPVYPEYIDLCCYVGPVALALALWLALRRASWRDPRYLGALALVAVGIFFALGKNAGVQYILPWIPVIRNLAGASRALVLTAAGLAILTALALDALTRRPSRVLGTVLIGAGAAALVAFVLRVAAAPQAREDGLAALLGPLVQAWAVAPSAIDRWLYPLLDAPVALAIAGMVLLLPIRFDRQRLGLLCGLLFALCWHFAPRVLPPTEKRPFFEPPPNVAFLQAERDRAPGAPFRVAGYDPLRLHDTEFDTPHKFQFLMPNMATLYRLEDINGFDPLILKNYLALFLATSGRAPHNDPIRNLDIARPDLRLFDLLGVRFLVGHPYDRRLTTIPLQFDPGQTEAAVKEWDPAQAGGPITHWLFVGLLNGALRIPLGTEVGRLHVEADEGTFDYPVRNGVELADWYALNFPPLVRAPGFHAAVNKEMWSNTLDPELGYRIRNAFYRGSIAFGRPLHVRRVSWRLLAPGMVLHVAAQAYRLAPPPPAQDPWVLRFGQADDIAPVYEYREARPRAVLVDRQEIGGGEAPGDGEVKVDEAKLNAASSAGAVEWLERGNSVLRLRVKVARPGLLVLREIWDAGWRAKASGAGRPILRVNGLLRGIEIPVGTSEVQLVYRPRLAGALLALAAAALLCVGVGAVIVLRRRSGSIKI